MVCMYASFAMWYLFAPDAEVPGTGGLRMRNLTRDNGGGSKLIC